MAPQPHFSSETNEHSSLRRLRGPKFDKNLLPDMLLGETRYNGVDRGNRNFQGSGGHIFLLLILVRLKHQEFGALLSCLLKPNGGRGGCPLWPYE